MTVRHFHTSVVKLTRLPIGASKEEIKEWFQGNDLVAEEVRLCGHGRSAFAVLKSVNDASKALQIRKPMRGQRASIYRSSKIEMEETLTPHDNCVHLLDLPFSVTKSDIVEFFSPLDLGENGIFLCLDRKGRQQGEGYVQFIDEQAARKAADMHGQILMDRIISVQRTNLKLMQLAQEKSFKGLFHRTVGKPGSEVAEVEEGFVKEGAMVKLLDLPLGVTEEKIKQWFKEDDVVVQKVFLPDKHKKSKKVRAFIHLNTLEDLKKTLQKDRRFMDTDIMMYNVPAWKVKQTLEILDFEDKIVHVKKLPPTYSKADVKGLFQGSHIAPAGIYMYNMPKRKGMLAAYVQFSDMPSAVRALQKNNTSVGGKKIIVERSNLKKREITKKMVATGKFKDEVKTNEKPMPTTKNKQNRRKSRKSQLEAESKSTKSSNDLEMHEDDSPVKKNAVPREAEILTNGAAVERLQSEGRQRRSSLKRKSILKATNVEQEKSLLKNVLVENSPKKRRRSSMRFAATPKLTS